MFKFSAILLLISIPPVVLCQETTLPESIKDIAEELADSDSDPAAASSYLERLYELADDPVNINSNDPEELSRLFFLSDFQIKALADYTRSTSKIVSFNEIPLIPGFDKSTAEMIIPFASLTGKVPVPRDTLYPHHFIISNISYKTGAADGESPGSPMRLMTRYRVTLAGISAGFTTEKDPGEKFFTPGTMNPDFFSGYLSYNGKGIIRRIIAGDFSARYGLGININTGLNTVYSLTSPGYIAAGNEVKPYTSTDENNFLRGIAGVFAYRRMGLSFFSSLNRADATTGSSSNPSGGFISSMYPSGIHNTPSGLIKKDALSESVYGANLSYNVRNLSAGLTWSESHFSLPFKPPENDPAKIFSFRGTTSDLFSLYYSTIIKKIFLFGEFSANDPGRYSIVQGLTSKVSDRLTISFMFRKYSPGFISLHGQRPVSGSSSYPEQSLFGSFSFEAARHLFISGGYDIRSFPWLRFRCTSPSRGSKGEVRIKYIPSNEIALDLLYSSSLSMSDKQAVNAIPKPEEISTRSLKLYARYSLNYNITFGTRIDFKRVCPRESSGILLLADISYRTKALPLSFWIRYCVFNTDDYESRIYTWENDLRYGYSIPALYGNGSRFYFMAGWRFIRGGEIRIKYGFLEKELSSAVTGIQEEVKIQFRLAI